MTDEQKTPATTSKRPYRRPVLETYGSLHAVTHIMGGTVGKNDGGGGPDKTGF